jgi:hypothetical protein
MKNNVNPKLFTGSDLNSDPIQIPIKPCCNLVVVSCFVMVPTSSLLDKQEWNEGDK